VRAPGEEGGVAAADGLEETTSREQLLHAAGQVAPQDAQARAVLADEEQRRAVGCRLGSGAGQRGRGLLELALLHQRVGEERGQRLAAVGFRLGRLASPHEGLRAEALRAGEGVSLIRSEEPLASTLLHAGRAGSVLSRIRSRSWEPT
jgi:hypothetical protein